MLMLVYCLVIVCGSLVGGTIPLLVRMTHTRMQLTLSFVGGAMLGVAILHLVPHAFYELHSVQHTVAWLLGGFLFMFFIERVFQFHHHDAPQETCDHEHEAGEQAAGAHVHGEHLAGHEHHAPHRPLNWPVALVGLSLHSALDGVALAAAVASEVHEPTPGGLAGLVVFLVVALHKPLDSMTLGALLALSEHSPARRHLINGLYALTVPLGVGLFYLGADHGGVVAAGAIGAALAFTAGTFLCIATSDLLPELHFHRHDRFKLSAALLLGVALAAGLVMLEESWHDHAPASAGSSHDHHDHEHHEH